MSEPRDKRVQKKALKFKDIVDSDPMRVDNFAKGKPTDANRKNTIYVLLCAIPVLLVVSMIFFLIAHVEGSMMGTPEQEADAYIAQRMKKFIKETPGANSSANKGSGADSKTIADELEDIQIGMKLVPNMDQDNYLLKRMINLTGSPSGSAEYDDKAMGDQGMFYEWDGNVKTKQEQGNLNFPVMNFNQDHMPLGDSVGMCLGIQWIPYKDRDIYDRYLNLRNLPECEESKHGRSQWEPNYPTHGISFNIWKQETKKGDSSCSGGIYVQNMDTCFRYKAMTAVCALVKFKHDQERNTYSWFYTGGCFKGNDPVNYEDVRVGDKKDFKDVRFEVRTDHRTFEEITALPQVDDDDDEGSNEHNSLTPNNKPPPKETDAERKIRQKREEWANKADDLADKSKGMYMFYQFFMFISGLCLFLAIICVCALIYQVVQISQGPKGDEGAKLINQEGGQKESRFAHAASELQ